MKVVLDDVGKIFVRHFVLAEGDTMKKLRGAPRGKTVWSDRGSKNVRLASGWLSVLRLVVDKFVVHYGGGCSLLRAVV